MTTELRNNCATSQYHDNVLSLCDSLHLNGALLRHYLSSDKPVGSMEMHIKTIFKMFNGVKGEDFFIGLTSLVSTHQSCKELPLLSCQIFCVMY